MKTICNDRVTVSLCSPSVNQSLKIARTLCEIPPTSKQMHLSLSTPAPVTAQSPAKKRKSSAMRSSSGDDAKKTWQNKWNELDKDDLVAITAFQSEASQNEAGKDYVKRASALVTKLATERQKIVSKARQLEEVAKRMVAEQNHLGAQAALSQLEIVSSKLNELEKVSLNNTIEQTKAFLQTEEPADAMDIVVPQLVQDFVRESLQDCKNDSDVIRVYAEALELAKDTPQLMLGRFNDFFQSVRPRNVAEPSAIPPQEQPLPASSPNAILNAIFAEIRNLHMNLLASISEKMAQQEANTKQLLASMLSNPEKNRFWEKPLLISVKWLFRTVKFPSVKDALQYAENNLGFSRTHHDILLNHKTVSKKVNKASTNLRYKWNKETIVRALALLKLPLEEAENIPKPLKKRGKKEELTAWEARRSEYERIQRKFATKIRMKFDQLTVELNSPVRMAQHITAEFTKEKLFCKYSDNNVGASDFAFTLVCLNSLLAGERPSKDKKVQKSLLAKAMQDIAELNTYVPSIAPDEEEEGSSSGGDSSYGSDGE